MLAYGEKVFDLSTGLSEIIDSRTSPQIPCIDVVNSILVMCVGRLGSLNSLEQLKKNSCLRKRLKGRRLPSADSLGRIFDQTDTDTLRLLNHRLYERLKRNKALHPPWHGLVVMAIDGHESHCTYRRHCEGCLEREIKSGDEVRIQYYHRNVTACLVFRNCRFLLDAEAQRPGEDEVACAIRLFDRVIASYPRAFDVVAADALYAKSNFFNRIIDAGKDVIAVLKDDRRDLLKDADSLFRNKPPTSTVTGSNGTTIECWDAEGFQSWTQVNKSVRVVRTLETKKLVRCQRDGELEQPPVTSWTWVTTLSPHRACTQAVVAIGHSRWSIENEGFNELVNHWHADHIYKHAPNAILNFWLMSMIAYNLFRAFYLRNLQPKYRLSFTMLHVARLIMSELYGNQSGCPP